MQLVIGLPCKWESGHGLVVRPWEWDGARDHRTTIRAALHIDGGFQLHRQGFYVHASTPEDILGTWSEPWDDIVLNWPGYSRTLFWSPAIQNQLTTEGSLRRLILPEDGHNNRVCHHAGDRGFQATAEDEWLVIHR